MDMTWHDTERKKDGKMRHLTDSETWKDVDKECPEFASDSRNLRLALSSDGFNPFHGNRTDYSSWTVLLSIYNLPHWLCMKRRGILLWTISDYPALGNMSGNVIKGYNACTICVDNTKATRFVHYRKTVVLRHRRWLPRHHPYRKQKTTFDNTVETDVAPIPLTGEQVFGRVQHLRGHVFGKTQRQPRWKKGEARPVWKKASIFFQLEYWKFLPVRHVLDVMHIGKNICEALLRTFLNIPGKRKDRESVRLDMADMGIRTELRPKTPDKKEKVPLASWNLSNAEKKVVCSSFLQIKLPDGFCSNIKNLVNMEKLRLGGMKSHDCHTILHHLLPISIRSVLQKQVSGYRSNIVSYSTKDRDDNRQVQCSGVSVVADTLMLVEKYKTVEQTAHTYYGVITSIWELDYNNFMVPIFRCNWVDINKGVKVDDLGFILVNFIKLGFINDPFVLGKHVKQVCYIDDPLEKFWSVVLKLPEKNFHDHCDEENDGSVEVELENDLHLPLFPNVDEHDDENTSYI
ncbi:uncharacterized protein LOC141674358 [Apium graveolens]|uniref:uncharacterized protein LOC141674358 n=1 Tax=Apium graveolens TaxID=4045 RepID=UPI003D79A639